MGDHNVSTDLFGRSLHRREICKEALGKLNDVVAGGRDGEVCYDVMAESISEDKGVRAKSPGQSVVATASGKMIAAVCTVEGGYCRGCDQNAWQKLKVAFGNNNCKDLKNGTCEENDGKLNCCKGMDFFRDSIKNIKKL